MFMFFIFIFTVVIISLFIELTYNKKHAKMVFILPEDYIIVKGKEVGSKDDVIIFNSDEIKRSEIYKHIPKTKRKFYHEKNIEEHLSRKMSKPFDTAVSDSKENFAENMPVSFIYKTAVGLVDFTRDIATGKSENSPYKMIISKNTKLNAFIDKNNIYLV